VVIPLVREHTHGKQRICSGGCAKIASKRKRKSTTLPFERHSKKNRRKSLIANLTVKRRNKNVAVATFKWEKVSQVLIKLHLKGVSEKNKGKP